MAHLVILYAPADAAAALDIQIALEGAGFMTVLDPSPESGWTYHTFLEGWLREAWAVIVLATPQAAAESLVGYLWAYALGAGKPVLPLIRDDEIELLPPLASRDPVLVAHMETWLARLRTVAADVCAAALPRVEAKDGPELVHARELLEAAASHTRGDGVLLLADSDAPLARDLLRAAAAHPIYADVRQAALGVLAQRGDSALLPLFIAALADGDDRVVQAAIAALIHCGTDAIEPLMAMVTGENRGGRRAAVLALAQITEGDIVPGLIAALGMQDWHVSRTAAVRLGQLGDTRAVDALNAALASKDEALVTLAQRALEQIAP